MAKNRIRIDAPPDRVFAVLADGARYADWVVGTKRIRSVEPHWPEPGSRFHHTFGLGPFDIDDSSSVIELEAGRRIALKVRGRPMGEARVDIELAPAGEGGTEVTMTERPTGGPGLLLFLNPLMDLVVLRHRNAESLRRLQELVERQPS